jgi:hypothetical protein
MLLANRRIAPALRTVELRHHRIAVLDPDLVDAILVAVERQDASVAAMPHRLQSVEDEFRR